jgi:hypothetical protein
MALALAVLGWGTSYKLSLYDPPGSPSASMPHAKLLSQRERPPATEAVSDFSPVLHLAHPVLTPGVFVVAVVLGLLLKVSFRAQSLTVIDLCRQVRFNSIFFSFRPPPSPFLAK